MFIAGIILAAHLVYHVRGFHLDCFHLPVGHDISVSIISTAHVGSIVQFGAMGKGGLATFDHLDCTRVV